MLMICAACCAHLTVTLRQRRGGHAVLGATLRERGQPFLHDLYEFDRYPIRDFHR